MNGLPLSARGTTLSGSSRKIAALSPMKHAPHTRMVSGPWQISADLCTWKDAICRLSGFHSWLVLILRVSLLNLHIPSSGWPFLPVKPEVGCSAFLGETSWRGVHRRHPPYSDYSPSLQSRSWDKGTVNCKITFFPQNPFPFFLFETRAFPQNFNE